MIPMRTARTFAALVLLGSALAGFAPATRAQEKVPVEGTDRYRVRYPDSTVSINDLCPVAKRPLGVHQTPCYVNGEPVGFC
jgi:hypothetical protein